VEVVHKINLPLALPLGALSGTLNITMKFVYSHRIAVTLSETAEKAPIFFRNRNLGRL